MNMHAGTPHHARAFPKEGKNWTILGVHGVITVEID